MIAAAQPIARRLPDVTTYFAHRIANTVAEGINFQLAAASGYALRAVDSANRTNRLPDYEFAQLDAHNDTFP